MLKRIFTLLLASLISTAFADLPDFCENPDNITIAAVGDVLLHQPLQKQGNELGYLKLWEQAIPFIHSADVAFANVEGPVAPGVNQQGRLLPDPGATYDGKVYSSYPMFNYPPQLAQALKDTGFDVVNLANNHTMDRYNIGVDATIETFNRVGIKHVGTSLKGHNDWYVITNSNNFKIAWIGCAEHTNGITDTSHQVLLCYQKDDRQIILNLIQQLKPKVNAIIITPHWGEQYQTQPNANQTQFAQQMLNAGATAVFGTHPHVLQPMTMYKTTDGREGFIAYSLGNFVSYQGTPANRASVILLLQLAKRSQNAYICAVRYVPIYMQNRLGTNKNTLQVLGAGDNSLPGYQIIAKILPTNNFVR